MIEMRYIARSIKILNHHKVYFKKEKRISKYNVHTLLIVRSAARLILATDNRTVFSEVHQAMGICTEQGNFGEIQNSNS